MISSFGGIIFENSIDKLYPINDINEKLSLNIEEQEVEGGLPKIYVKSVSLEDLSFSVKLMSRLGVDVDSEIKKWKDMLKAKGTHDFIVNNKKQGGKWILTSVSINKTIPGEVAEISVDAKQFSGYGSKKEKENDKKTKSTEVKANRDIKTNSKG